MTGEDAMGLVPTLLFMVFGLVYAFFGGRFIKVMLALLGAALGLSLGTLISVAVAPGNPLAYILLGLFGLIAGALLFGLLYKLAIYLVGFTVGSMVGPLVVMMMGIAPDSGAGWLIVLVCGIIGGLVAVLLEKQLMALLSAIIGSIFAVLHLRLLMANHYPVTANDVGAAYEATFMKMWWLVLILIVLGTWSQLHSKRRAIAD